MAADHRVLDGVSAAKYLNRVVHYLENPALLLRKP
jgi:pyruvate/2-oxoglutarate dehydrogenase complex dihydrolipoamide acyltransferase (E2) component